MMLYTTFMTSRISHQILNLEKEIIRDENELKSFLKSEDVKEFEKSRQRLKTDLKHLSRVINGEFLEEKENKQVINFLITHYNYLQKIPIYP